MTIGLLLFVLFCVDFDTGGAKRKEAFSVFAEIEDLFLGVESTVFGFVEMEFCHGNLYSL